MSGMFGMSRPLLLSWLLLSWRLLSRRPVPSLWRGLPSFWLWPGSVLVAAVLLTACGAETREASPGTQPGPDAITAQVKGDLVADSPLYRIARAERETVFSGWKTATLGPEGGRQTRMKVSRLAGGRTYMVWDEQGRTDMRWVYRSRNRWIDDPSLLATNYEAVEVENADATVAWRDTRTFEVRSRRTGRPSMTLVVDSERWLVLSEVLRDFEGEQTFEWHFDTVEFDPAEAPEEWPEGSGLPVEDAGMSGSGISGSGTVNEPEVAVGALQPETLPTGFVHLGRRAIGDDGVADDYSDGLAAFVIRQRPASLAEAPLAGGAAEGELSCNTWSGRSAVSGTFAGTEVSIHGNLPLEELEALAASLRVGP
jgi:hypothetical protein